jgi:ACS family glucarate transporter-like MFS transporter
MVQNSRLPIRSRLVFLLFLLSAVGYLDRTNISIAGAAIRDELHTDNVHLGYIFSAFLIGYAGFQILGGWLACRFGPRRILAAGVVWWGLFTALTTIANPALGHALLWLIAIRFLLGAGEAVIYPASNQFVAHWIPVPERGRANGWVFAGVGAGAGFSVPVLSWILSRFGWRASFWFSAFTGIAVGLAWYLAARDTPEEHPNVSPRELAFIQTTRNVDRAAREAPAVSWRRVILNRNVAALTLSGFTFGYVAWIFFSWFFIYMAQVRGLNLKANAIFSMIPFVAMTVCCLAGGSISDALARRFGLRAGRCGIAVVAMIAASGIIVIGSQARATYAASLILAGGVGALYLAQSSFWAVSADIAGEHSGVVSGVMNMGCQAGGAVTSSLTPWIAAHYGWNSAFVFAALLAATGGLLWLFIDPGRPYGVPASPRDRALQQLLEE